MDLQLLGNLLSYSQVQESFMDILPDLLETKEGMKPTKEQKILAEAIDACGLTKKNPKLQTVMRGYTSRPVSKACRRVIVSWCQQIMKRNNIRHRPSTDQILRFFLRDSPNNLVCGHKSISDNLDAIHSLEDLVQARWTRYNSNPQYFSGTRMLVHTVAAQVLPDVQVVYDGTKNIFNYSVPATYQQPCS